MAKLIIKDEKQATNDRNIQFVNENYEYYSQISNHFISYKLSHSRIMVKVMHFFKRSKNGYGYFLRSLINSIILHFYM